MAAPPPQFVAVVVAAFVADVLDQPGRDQGAQAAAHADFRAAAALRELGHGHRVGRAAQGVQDAVVAGLATRRR